MSMRKTLLASVAPLAALAMTLGAVPAFADEAASAGPLEGFSGEELSIPADGMSAGGVVSAATRGLSGTTTAQPFVANRTAASNHFRIPSVITLDNGWLLAGADARWSSYGDSPNNLDGLACLSKDGGATWEWQLVNEFVDCASTNAGGNNSQSASFIDPTFIQDSSGAVYMVADAWPAGSGIWGAGGDRCDITGFDEQGNFLLAKGSPDAIASLDGADYTYYADASAARTFAVGGKQATLRPIKDAQGTPTGAWVDAFYNLFDVQGDTAAPSMTKQHGTNAPVQNNVFYKQSEYKAYPTCYLWLVKGEVQGDGIVWGEPSIIDVKNADDQPFTGICPGRGLVVPLEGGGERVMFQIYESKRGGNEAASAIWTDDGGKTWQRGARADRFNGAGKSSESQTVLLPNGDIRMYSRNSAGFISYCDSKDGGATWGPYALDRELAYTGNCMVSFINVAGALVSPDGTVYEHLIAASYPKTQGRQDGVIRLGSIDAQSGDVTWLNPADVRYPGKYLYSCLTQTADGFALVYENQGAPDGSKDIVFETFSASDAMGEGWAWVESAPRISLSAKEIALGVGETKSVSLQAQGVESAHVRWSISSDGAAEAAKLDRDQGALDEAVSLTGAAPGKATLTARVQVDVDGAPLVLSASARVYVSGEGQVVLPDEYDIPAAAAPVDEYVVQNDGAVGGVYLIYGDKASSGGRILYLHTGATTDRLRSDVADGRVAPDTSGKFPIERQRWAIERTDEGYTVKNGSGETYLNVTGAHANGLPYGSDPTYFSFEKASESGRWVISTEVDGTVYYVGQDASTGNFTASTQKNDGIILGKETRSFDVSAEGLAALIDDARRVADDPSFDRDAWRAFSDALAHAEATYDEQARRHDSSGSSDAAIAALDAARDSLYRAMAGLSAQDGDGQGGHPVVPDPDPNPDPNPDPDPDSPDPSPDPDPEPDVPGSDGGNAPGSGDEGMPEGEAGGGVSAGGSDAAKTTHASASALSDRVQGASFAKTGDTAMLAASACIAGICAGIAAIALAFGRKARRR